MSSDQFQNKVVIVTGSSAGIGQAIALLFASRGARVTVSGRNKERLESVLQQLSEVSVANSDRPKASVAGASKFLAVPGDVNDPSVRREIIQQTIIRFGRLDILVANAGIFAPRLSVAEADEETYDSTFNTNLKSIFFLIKEATPHLVKSKGNIVNISSTGSTMASPFGSLYVVSKIALDHLTRCLAAELGPKGIRVNAVNPGFIQTLVLRQYSQDVDATNIKIQEFELRDQALKERTGTGADVAELVAFLVSDAASFITGECIKVDGGRSLGPPVDWSHAFLDK